MGKRRSALKLFLDSSALFTAVNSSFGGSAKLFSIEGIELVVSKVVLHEVEKNVRLKLGDEMYLERFFMLVDMLNVVDAMPDISELNLAKKVIAEKDSVILAQFKRSDCTHLITLDKRDFLQDRVMEYVSPKKIWTPKMFFDSGIVRG